MNIKKTIGGIGLASLMLFGNATVSYAGNGWETVGKIAVGFAVINSVASLANSHGHYSTYTPHSTYTRKSTHVENHYVENNHYYDDEPTYRRKRVHRHRRHHDDNHAKRHRRHRDYDSYDYDYEREEYRETRKIRVSYRDW